jgi:hypothetical protein
MSKAVSVLLPPSLHDIIREDLYLHFHFNHSLYVVC